MIDDSLTAPPPQSSWERIAGTVRDTVSYYHAFNPSSSIAWGKATATIDASASLVFASRWSLGSFENICVHVTAEGPTAIRRVVDPSPHSMLYVFLARMPLGVSDRLFALWFSWRRESDGSCILAFAPAEDSPYTAAVTDLNKYIADDPVGARAIRATVRGYWKFKARAPEPSQRGVRDVQVDQRQVERLSLP